MTEDLQNLIRRAEEEMLTADVISVVKGGASSNDDGADPQMLDVCSNVGICTNTFLCDLGTDLLRCITNTDACGPVVDPKLQLTCKPKN